MKKEKTDNSSIKKPIYKKWWFWVIIIVVLAAIFGRGGATDGFEDGVNQATNSTTSTEETQTESETESNLDGIDFSVSKVRNDVTGNWRISLIAENIEMQDYALSYYKEHFGSDDEIHAIVNFNYNTTTKISVIGNQLDVSVYEYVDKEEHDAKMLFSGMLLKEYHVNIDDGEIEEVY